MIPVLIAGAVIGIKAHAKASADNEIARNINAQATEIIDEANSLAQRAKTQCQNAMDSLANEKKRVIENNIRRFVDYFSIIKSVNFSESGEHFELAQFNKNELPAIKLMVTNVQKFSVNNAVGGLSGIALAVGAADIIAGGTILAGAGISLGRLAGGAALGTIAAPIFAITGIFSASEAAANVQKAQSNYAKAQTFKDECITYQFFAKAVSDRCDLFHDTLKKVNDEWFTSAVDRLSVLVNSKLYQNKKMNAEEVFTKEEIGFLASVASLAKMVKTLIDTNILDGQGQVTPESAQIINNINVKLNSGVPLVHMNRVNPDGYRTVFSEHQNKTSNYINYHSQELKHDDIQKQYSINSRYENTANTANTLDNYYTTYPENLSSNKTKSSDHPILKFILAIAIVALSLFSGYWIYSHFSTVEKPDEYPGKLKLAYSADYYIGKDFYDTAISLQKKGFQDISLCPLDDLKSGDKAIVGGIENIEIDGNSAFTAGTWIRNDAKIIITYHSYLKEVRNGFDMTKNSHLVIDRIDFSIPSYFTLASEEVSRAFYSVKKDKGASLGISFDNKKEWSELKNFDSKITTKYNEINVMSQTAEYMHLLAKKEGRIYSIHIANIVREAPLDNIHLVLTTYAEDKNEYFEDFEAILSGIYVPTETEIRVDFSQKSYKGKKVEDVIATLKEKGFKNVQSENMKDVIIGIITKEGSVDSILVDGRDDFKEGDWIDEGTEIVVRYHGK
jgi:hypothetical protein